MDFLLDTDICIAVLRGKSSVVKRLQAASPDDCGISAVTAYELFAGAAKSRAPEKERPKVERLLHAVRILPFDGAAAAQAGLIRADLERRGTPVGPYDLLIAAQALAAGLTLVTGNTNEFQRIAGLRLEAWL